MRSNYPPPKLTPAEFEKEVRDILNALGVPLVDFRTEHREIIPGSEFRALMVNMKSTLLRASLPSE